ncbi:MAG: EutN/CcmL family microcompartment protein [Terriglobales bacterium]
MFLARVTGTVVSTIKDDGLRARKLLLIQPLDASGASVARAQVALDAVGAGVGEIVYVCRGKEASFAWDQDEVPTETTIVGIVDPAANRRWMQLGMP